MGGILEWIGGGYGTGIDRLGDFRGCRSSEQWVVVVGGLQGGGIHLGGARFQDEVGEDPAAARQYGTGQDKGGCPDDGGGGVKRRLRQDMEEAVEGQVAGVLEAVADFNGVFG